MKRIISVFIVPFCSHSEANPPKQNMLKSWKKKVRGATEKISQKIILQNGSERRVMSGDFVESVWLAHSDRSLAHRHYKNRTDEKKRWWKVGIGTTKDWN